MLGLGLRLINTPAVERPNLKILRYTGSPPVGKSGIHSAKFDVCDVKIFEKYAFNGKDQSTLL